MAVRKQCKAKGCRYGDSRCEHPWWLDVMLQGKRYRMRVNDFAAPRMAAGERHLVTSKQEAERVWEARFLAEIMAGRDPRDQEQENKQKRSLTIAEFSAEYLTRHCEAQGLHLVSVGQRLNRIKANLGARPIRDLENPLTIEDFAASLKGRAVATVNRYLALLRHMIGWGIGRGFLTSSPFYNKVANPNGVRLRKGEAQRKRRLHGGEEEALLGATDSLWQQNKVDHEYVARVMRARIEMAIDFGLRKGELRKIRNGDVNWQAGDAPILTIRAMNAKSKKERRIAIVSPRVVLWLRARRLVGGAEGHPYGDEMGRQVTSFEKAWQTIRQTVHTEFSNEGYGVDLHWHDLRHECGSRLSDSGVDGRRIQELLGHSTLVTTQRYLNTDVISVGTAMKKAMGW
jgi:integrase